MLVEYKLTFENNGLTVTTRIESDAGENTKATPSSVPAGDHSLKSSISETEAAKAAGQTKIFTPLKKQGAESESSSESIGSHILSGTAPVFLIGPIFCRERSSEPNSPAAGGFSPSNKPGGTD